MTNLEIGNKLVDYCKNGENMKAIEELYSENIESVEAVEGDEKMPRTIKGISNVKEKNNWWFNNHEIHDSSVAGPYAHGDNKFATFFKFDVTNKEMNQRMKMEEVAVYTVNNDKIIKEEFFYTFG